MIKKITNITNALRVLFLVTTLGFVNTSHAVSIGLTLDSDKDPLGLTTGEMITFTVGITPENAIAGYILDIRFDNTELSFVSSKQLVPIDGAVSNYSFDPATTPIDIDVVNSGLDDSNSGRAVYFLPLFSVSDLVGNIFSLTFTVQDLISDGLDDLVVGILNERANDITPPAGINFTFDRNKVTAQVAAVPVPAAAWLFGTGLIGLVTIIRSRNAS